MINREELNALAEAGRNNTINIEDIDFEDVKKFYESTNISENFNVLLIDLGPKMTIEAALVQIAHRYLEVKLGMFGSNTELANQISRTMVELYSDIYQDAEVQYSKWILKSR